MRSPRSFLHLPSLLLPLLHPHLPLLKMILKVFFHLAQPNSHSFILYRIFPLQSFLLCMQVLEILGDGICKTASDVKREVSKATLQRVSKKIYNSLCKLLNPLNGF